MLNKEDMIYQALQAQAGVRGPSAVINHKELKKLYIFVFDKIEEAEKNKLNLCLLKKIVNKIFEDL